MQKPKKKLKYFIFFCAFINCTKFDRTVHVLLAEQQKHCSCRLYALDGSFLVSYHDLSGIPDRSTSFLKMDRWFLEFLSFCLVVTESRKTEN